MKVNKSYDIDKKFQEAKAEKGSSIWHRVTEPYEKAIAASMAYSVNKQVVRAKDAQSDNASMKSVLKKVGSDLDTAAYSVANFVTVGAYGVATNKLRREELRVNYDEMKHQKQESAKGHWVNSNGEHASIHSATIGERVGIYMNRMGQSTEFGQTASEVKVTNNEKEEKRAKKKVEKGVKNKKQVERETPDVADSATEMSGDEVEA